MNRRYPSPIDHLLARGLRLAGLGVAASFYLCAALPAFAAQPVGPDPALVRLARDAQQTMEQLARLREQAGATRAAAARLSQSANDALAAWQDYQLADVRARATMEQARDCLPVLQQKLEANTAALASRIEAVARSRQAVQDLASAEGELLAPAAGVADVAFQQRQAAQKTFAAQHRAASQQASTCASRTRSAQWDILGLQDRAQEAADLARDLAPQHRALRVRWQTTAQAFAAAQQARLLVTNNVNLADATDAANEPLEQLARAIQSTGLAERTGIPSRVQLGPLTASRGNMERLTTELERLQDAAAYIELSTVAPSSACANNDCAGLMAERQDLASRMADTQARLAQAVAQWQQSPAAMGEQLVPLAATRKALNERMQPVASSLGPAVTETTATGLAVREAAVQLEASAELAHDQARLAWEQAYRLAYGKPPRPVPQASVSELASMHASQEYAAAMIAPDIRSHAYELFSSFDEEIADFGAYTYVLVRSASDLQTPTVRQRFQQLLSILQTLPSAGLVASSDKPHVNVFCIPVTPGNEDARDAGEVAYASDLGQQLKMRAQNGLLTQKAVRQRLTSSPGPFLITLPGRLAAAQSGTPVLLADLSSYPPDAIADLTQHYMNGLVDDFPRQQALWKPPVLQRVALFMIHLAEGTGQLVTSALPTAQAQPRPP